LTYELPGINTVDTKAIEEDLSALGEYWSRQKHWKHFNTKTIEEAVSLLSNYMEEARIVAGGTDLVRLMKNKVMEPKVLVNIKTIPELKYIKEDAEGLKIGPLTTIKDIEASPIIRKKYTMLAKAAHLVASPHIRNMATISGNLCQDIQCWYYRRPLITGNSFFCYRKGGQVCYAIAGKNAYHAILGGDKCFAVCPSDMAPSLIALEANIKIASAAGEKKIPLEDFYTPLGNILKPDEIIIEIQVPATKPTTKQQYLKFRLRKTIDFALSSVAAVITTEGEIASNSRIILGGVAPIPYRALRAEEAIKGKGITDSIAETAARAAVSEAKPLSMNAYKVPITESLVKRAIVTIIS
jgi:xanthine dehydrogenase YagS FAD-binding subunit